MRPGLSERSRMLLVRVSGTTEKRSPPAAIWVGGTPGTAPGVASPVPDRRTTSSARSMAEAC